MNLKFLFPLIGLACGILFSSEVIQGLGLGFVLIGLSLLIWCGLTIISKNPVNAIKVSKYHSVWILLLFAGIGSIVYNFRCVPSVPFELDGKKATYFGIIDEVKYASDGDRFKVSVTSLHDKGGHPHQCTNLHFLVKTDGFLGSPGDKISFIATPKKFKSQKGSAEIDKRMAHQGLQYYANVKSKNISKTGEDTSLFFKFHNLKNKLIILLEKSSLNRDTSEFLISILLGDKSLLSSEVRSTLNSAGMAHILALSGTHIAIILSLLLWILFPFSLLGYHKTRKIIAITILWLFVVLTGGAPSTIRAAIMASFVIGAYILERRNTALNSLLAATLIILLIDPIAIWNVGLQLSFLCVASIIIFTNRLNPIEHHTHPKLYVACNVILITIITTLCTWALVSYYFGVIPVAFLLSNVVLLPFLPFFIACGILYLILLSAGIDWSILSKFLDYFNSLFIGSADLLSFGGEASITFRVPVMSAILWIAGIIGLGVVLNSQNRKNKKSAVLISTLTLVSSFLIIIIPSEEHTSKIRFQHSFTKMEIHHTNADKVTKYEFPRNSVSNIDFPDFQILAVDNIIHKDSIRQMQTLDISKPNYLIVGEGSDTNQIAELINNSGYSRIVLHSTIGKNKKAELFSLINESELNKIYSLGENGSLEFDL
ncbi:MAG: ComEC/Rec2 family competence protein [Muribaculaceae bacterium]|nr:ComEC/Rec2 family competence protein [Muribaculaceae bacterium]